MGASRETQCNIHVDGTFLKPTVYFDDEVIADKGRLLILDDPEIREIAGQYGDPDVILSSFGHIFFRGSKTTNSR